MFGTIAVGTDGSQTAAVAVDFAIELAERYEARLVIMSASVPESDPAPVLGAAAARAGGRGLEVTTVSREGTPAEVLCELAADAGADVLVIGNKGIKRRILGSIPNSVAHNAPCAVMIVKTT